MDHRVTLERGLREAHRQAAALIFEDAFGTEQRVAVPDAGKRLRYLERVIDARHIVTAVRDAELVGLMGLSSREPTYSGGVMHISWDPRQLRDLLGWAGAAWAQWGTRLAMHHPAAGELYIDGLAVAATARGIGIGTSLLGEAEAIAAELGLEWLRLDVLDTNPRAQALYERVGYRATGLHSLRHKRRWAGFSGLIPMERPVRRAIEQPGLET